MKKIIFLIVLTAIFINLKAQDQKSKVSGNFEITAQTYQTDSAINAIAPDDLARFHVYSNILYNRGKFYAGIRYEAYQRTMLGFDSRYDGHGLANRYVRYKGDLIDITAGNFYEQFGNGLVLRAYEDKSLGYDNSFDGVRAIIKPTDGIKITGLVGRQRKYWEKSKGIVRATDAEFDLNSLITPLSDKKTRVIVAGSFVSKYEKADDPVYNFPENVGAISGRLGISRGLFNISGEYAYKINDPSKDNGYIFKDGNALFINSSFSSKGMGVLLSVMRLDNMSFRSERNAGFTDVSINYLPALAKTHTYALPAMYPFATQANGQVGINAEVFYKFKRKTLLGGKYGTNISLNYSQINSIEKTDVLATKTTKDGYTSDFFSIGDEVYFRDINFELHKKINKYFKFALCYYYQEYNMAVLQGTYDEIVKSNIVVLDATYRLNRSNALRFELQNLQTKEDMGNWIAGAIEYTYSPHWFAAISDQYNYGNDDSDKKVHYLYASAGYTRGSSRIELGYGKQRDGIVCVGGVCRNVPASNGFMVRISTSF